MLLFAKRAKLPKPKNCCNIRDRRNSLDHTKLPKMSKNGKMVQKIMFVQNYLKANIKSTPILASGANSMVLINCKFFFSNISLLLWPWWS